MQVAIRLNVIFLWPCDGREDEEQYWEADPTREEMSKT